MAGVTAGMSRIGGSLRAFYPKTGSDPGSRPGQAFSEWLYRTRLRRGRVAPIAAVNL